MKIKLTAIPSTILPAEIAAKILSLSLTFPLSAITVSRLEAEAQGSGYEASSPNALHEFTVLRHEFIKVVREASPATAEWINLNRSHDQFQVLKLHRSCCKLVA